MPKAKELPFDGELLRDIALIPGVSGDEGQIRDRVKKEFEKCKIIDEIKVDGMGNIMGYINKDKNKDTILVSAHLDTVGMRVTKIHDSAIAGVQEGSLVFEDIGLARDQLGSIKVRIHTAQGNVPAVICTQGVHIRFEDNVEYDLDAMVIDTGATSYNEVRKMGVDVGDSISFDGEVEPMGTTRLVGPFLDNRIGVANIITLAQNLDKKKLKTNLILAGTVHEESELSGIKCLANNVKPNAAIVMDTTTAMQHDADIEMGLAVLDKGVAIEMGTFANKKLIKMAIDLAKKYGIKHQKEVIVDVYTVNESYAARWQGFGIPTLSLSYPVRYLHSSVEMVDMRDVSDTLTLVKYVLYNITSGMKYL